jgi:hypothetical protein
MFEYLKKVNAIQAWSMAKLETCLSTVALAKEENPKGETERRSDGKPKTNPKPACPP